MSSYKKPRRLNAVSLLFWLAAVGLVYGAIKFGPPYYRKWRVTSILGETCNKAYPLRGQLLGAGADVQARLQQDAVNELHAAGVEDPGLDVEVQCTTSEIRVTAQYREIITHPVVNKVTTLSFRPSVSIPVR